MEPTTLPSGVRIRDFYDPATTRKEILDRVQQAYLSRFPIENDRVKIELLSTEYDINKSNYTLAQQKKALLEGSRLSVPLHGRFRLSDAVTKQPIEEKDVLLANVPWMSNRHTIVNGGNEYAIGNQYRLRPGVFARQKDNGELESHINTRSGTGPQMRIFMEPSTGVYRVKLQQANLKLYPILQALGAKDEDIAKEWGPEILKANQEVFDKQTVGKFHEKLIGNKADLTLSPEIKHAQIIERLAKSELDPEITQRTLGEPHKTINANTLLKASSKLLQISRGEVPEDDRDSLANKSVHSVEDFMEEHVKKDSGGLARNLLYKTGYDRTLKALRPGYFTPQLDSVVVGNQLSMPISGINLMEFRDSASRATSLGEGGISDMSAIPNASRNVHSSYLNFQDPIRSSESRAIGIDSRFAHKARKGSDNQIYSPFKNRRSGEIEYLTPSQLNSKVVSFAPSPSLFSTL